MRSLFREYSNRSRIVKEQTDESRTFQEDGPNLKPAYQKFFEGWSTREEILPSGKHMMRRVYVGPVYRDDLEQAARTRQKRRILLLLLGCIGLLVLSTLICDSAGTRWYVYVPQTLAVLCCLFLLWYVFIKLTARADLTIREYRDVALGYPRCALALALCLLLTAVTTLLHMLLQGFSLRILGSAAAALAAAVCAWELSALELSVGYLRLDPGQDPLKLR